MSEIEDNKVFEDNLEDQLEIEDLLEDQEVKSMNDNLGTILYIMLGRIYDQLTLIADAQGKGEDMMKLMELHRQGHLMSPIPTLAMPDSEEKE